MRLSSSLPVLALLLQTVIPSASAASNPAIRQHDEHFLSGGRKIRVETFAPAQSGRFPAVLVLHTSAGMLAGKSELELFSKKLAAQGMVAFLVHYFDRTGTLFAGDKAIHELSPSWVDTVHDAVSFAASHPQVRPEEIGIFGYSLGAYLGVAESSTDTRVKAVAEIAGGILDHYQGKIRRLPPILILHGNADERVPVKNALQLEKVARQLGGKPQIHLYEGEGHRLSSTAGLDAAARALRFLNERLAIH